MPGPLDGVRVADFAEIIAGPLAGRLLADMGAEVIKVEPPWGEPWRLTQRFMPTESRSFMSYNAGKRSLPLDLTKPESQDILSRLIPEMDVVLVNFRPDVAAKLGVDYETLSAMNPRLIYCELTAFGRQGPDGHRPGYDVIIQAMSGMMAAEDKVVNGIPQWVWSTPLIDTTSGMCMAWCVCGALYARERTGQGQKVETSLLSSALSLMGARLLQVESLDGKIRAKSLEDISTKRAASASYQETVAASRASRRQQHHGDIYYRAYLTKDGPIVVGCLSDPLRQRLLETLNLSDISIEPGYDPNTPESRAFASALAEQAEGLFREKSSTQWLEIFEERGIPASRVRFLEEVFDDPQVQANGLVVEVEHKEAGKVKMFGTMAQFSETPLPPTAASPALGEHSADILQELGYSEEEIRCWREAKIVG